MPILKEICSNYFHSLIIPGLTKAKKLIEERQFNFDLVDIISNDVSYKEIPKQICIMMADDAYELEFGTVGLAIYICVALRSISSGLGIYNLHFFDFLFITYSLILRGNDEWIT